MSTPYEDYKKAVRKYAEDMAPVIDAICKDEVPQHILWKKTVADAIAKRIGGECFVREAGRESLLKTIGAWSGDLPGEE